NKEEGKPAMASPHAGPATHGQVTAKAPCKGAVGCGHGQLEKEANGARKGRQPPVGAAPAGRSATREHDRLRPARRGGNRLQHVARKGDRLQGARKGLLPATSPVASRRGGRPLSRWLLASKGNRRLCRGSGGGGGVEGERGLGHPLEKRMIMPL
ncbi:hypothetical protein GW17_00059081, partial [Ensete ventricosum]